MARIDQYSRIRHHRLTTSGLNFTVPTSEDHTDGTWLPTDLYLGELGINMTDDKIFFRTNNGIVQIATGTSSGGATGGAAVIWNFQSPNIVIGSTYSADSVSPRSGYYTDLGTSTLRWKDLYLGGSSGGSTTIDVNAGLRISSSSGGVLTTDGIVSTNAPIEIHTNSSNANKDRVLFLNTRGGLANGSTNYITVASSQTVTTDDTSFCFVAASTNLSFANGLSNVVHLGKSNSKQVWKSDTVFVGANLAVRGDFTDDGTGQYEKSEWITTQSRLATSDALWTDIAQIPWTDISNGGEIIYVEASILGTIINDTSNAYSANIRGVFSLDNGPSDYTIGQPILEEWSSFGPTSPQVELSSDTSNVYIKVKGVGVLDIQWLCTYKYHRLIKVY